MNKTNFFFVFILFLFSISLDAAIYKGQKYFVKKCAICHIDKQSFINEKTIKEWSNLLDKKGLVLANIHLKGATAQKSWDYFNSKRYKKDSKHIKQFLMEYAKDSGNVPACN